MPQVTNLNNKISSNVHKMKSTVQLNINSIVEVVAGIENLLNGQTPLVIEVLLNSHAVEEHHLFCFKNTGTGIHS
jgi:hypothetical protein